MDKRGIAAVVLCVAFLILYPQILKLIGLDKYLYPPKSSPTRATSTAVDSSRVAAAARPLPPAATPGAAATGASNPGAATPPSLGATPLVARSGSLERSYAIETPLYRATFSDRGARLVAVELKNYVTAHGVGVSKAAREEAPHVALGGGPSFGLDLGSGASLRSLAELDYAVSESLDAAGDVRTMSFTARDSSGVEVRQTWRVRPEDYALDLQVTIRGVPDAMRISDYTLTTRSWPLLTEANQLADERALRASSLVGTNIHRDHPGQLNKGPKDYDGNVVWSAVQTRYFVGAVALVSGPARGSNASTSKRPLSSEEVAALGPDAKPEQDVVHSGLVMALPSSESPVHRFVVYFGPLEYQRLAKLHLQLERVVDMGWTWLLPFSTTLLSLMKWIYGVLRNYGLAIVALATLVRVVLHPLNVTSIKSMRAMQRLQPELARIKEKYKHDPQAFNAATMALYKENKVNPASGCLPMFVQMPLFFALYQVLYNSIELRRAPFVAWMQDLSAPDLAFTIGPLPVRLLPLLMAGSGLLQQSVTPTDPTQRPTMYMMNVVMLVFFYNLPSGLVLYWTVMNLLTALQQWMVLRQDGGAVVPAVQAAPVTARGRRK